MWDFQQTFLNPDSDMPEHGDAFIDGSKVNESDYSLVGSPGFTNAVYMVQGSNNVRWVKSVASTTKLEKEDGPGDQEFLKDKSPDGTEDQTSYVSTGLWQHHPRETPDLSDLEMRHPLDVCRDPEAGSGECPG